MLFNSFTFVVFFAFVLCVYHTPFPWRPKKLFLLVMSYVFYAAWSAPFVTLLWISTIVDWFCARAVANAATDRRRRLYVLISLCTNLGILGVFKYGGFALDNTSMMLQLFGVEAAVPAWNVILPVGISFYTFQTISYTIDVYRGLIKPVNSVLDFALYVTFFPQLVAGPIVRAGSFLPQLEEKPVVRGEHLGWGLNLMLIGLFQKIVVADQFLAPVVHAIYEDPSGDIPTFANAWLGQFAFAGQIFCDFSGYSSCAIGAAMCMGIELPDNFRFPYASIGIVDFWRRWHISLSTWLRDYLYIPLGGNRKGPQRTVVNLIITMFLGGLWHGAAWTFVAWGLFHGALLGFERAIQRTRIASVSFWKTRSGRAFLMGITFALVCIGWVFFRAGDFRQAYLILGAMFGYDGTEYGLTAILSNAEAITVVVITVVLVGLHVLLRDTTLEELVDRVPGPVIGLANAAMLLCILTSTGEDRAFIYFQF